MSQIDDVAYGLAIFKVYGAKYIQAEHDEIYCETPGGMTKISDSDLDTLELLNWHYDDKLGSWKHFV